ncbi:MAG TPA: hypothetical protein VF017_04705 [Thermoanaerobaculia bacterium]|nr:hypothetical protein [Thermoanaerobaculia bacterium]
MTPLLGLEQAVLARQGKREGSEIRFRCPYPERHANGDAHPSARYCPDKGAWYCDACKESGGWRNLYELLGVERRQRGGEVVATYAYTDEQGRLLFEVVRKANPKSFLQRRPDGSGGWVWNLKGVRRVPYRLPEVLSAVREGQTVYVVEGEKDADNLAKLGLTATTNAGGAGKWNDSYSEVLCGARVVILPDNDTPGKDHARKVARSLQGIAAEVRIVTLPELPSGGDVSDWIAAQGLEIGALIIGAELERLAEGVGPQELAAAVNLEEAAAKPTQAQLLVELGKDAKLFHTPDGQGFAVIPSKSHRETWPIKSGHLRQWLVRLFYERFRKPPSAQALQDALGLLEARACFDGPEGSVYVRVAAEGGAVYLDLGNQAWEVVEITRAGWRTTSSCPVRFFRPKGMGALPRPIRGGSVQELRSLLNLGSDEDFILFVAWLVGALRGSGPYPVLNYQGEQGSAKSTQARIARKLLDPATAPLRTMPRDERDLMIAATHGWVPAFDNLSGLPVWLSDALCRLSTGGGFSTRQLFTDTEETIFSAMRPVIVNGIEAVVTRQDLLDRCITLVLPPILESKRQTEAELWAAFDKAHPRILGALLDAVSRALANLDRVNLATKPRMADFATWVVAAEDALPWPAGAFLRAYAGNRAEAVETALEGDAVAMAVRRFAEQVVTWEGTAAGLLERLCPLAGDKACASKQWPQNPRGLSGRLRRAATFLRSAGVEVDFGDREAGSGRRLLKISRRDPHSTVTTVTKGPDAPQTAEAMGLTGVTVGVTVPSPDSATVTDRHGGNPPVSRLRDGCDGRDGPMPPQSDPLPQPADELAL